MLGTTSCSTGSEPPPSGGENAGHSGTNVYINDGGTGGSSASAGQGAGGGLGSGNNAGSSGEDGEELGACGASTLAAQEIVVEKEVEVTKTVTKQKPVTLYIMFDKSMSMDGYNSSTSKYDGAKLWNPAVAALKSFFRSEKSKDVGVALQFFPISSGKCNGEGYSTPRVGAGILPGHAAALEKALDDADPDGTSTPIEGALRGVTQYCTKYQQDHAGEQCVAVLVTDGKPERACPMATTSTIVGIAEAAHTAGVTTFAVGLKGADFSLLNEIAKKGGAPDCDTTTSAYACDVSSDAGKLADALNSIRDTVVTTETVTEIVKEVQSTKLPCEWTIPENTNDDLTFDRNKVNIRYTVGENVMELLRADSPDKCKSNAWYYDNPSAPTRFIACPDLCTQLEATTDAKIDVLLGCETKVVGPD